MSVQPAERVETDLSVIEALDFENAKSCEHSQHRTIPRFHADGDEQYVVLFYPCCGAEPDTLILCGKFVSTVIKGHIVKIHCLKCGTDGMEPSDVYKVLGPVGVGGPNV